jgi:hypothetical protein
VSPEIEKWPGKISGRLGRAGAQQLAKRNKCTSLVVGPSTANIEKPNVVLTMGERERESAS